MHAVQEIGFEKKLRYQINSFPEPVDLVLGEQFA
jgi:hypothetical protein